MSGKYYAVIHLLLLLVFSASATPAMAQTVGQANASTRPEQDATVQPPAWLEPRGLGIVDLVGLVPESHLVDTIISSRVGSGIVRYVSGNRDGGTVTINVRIEPRYWSDGNSWASLFGCLGKPAIDDEWPVAAPPASMRVYANGNEVTSQIGGTYDYVPAGQHQPDNDGTGWWRYEFRWGQRTTFNDDGSVAVPANMGCHYNIPRRLTNMTATFVIETTNYLTVETVGSESFTFHSYIGTGNAGHLGALNSQMEGRYGTRHDKFDLAVPATADYMLVKFPPTPVDPYMGQPDINIALPSSGTYRVNGSDNTLSVDHVSSMGLPLYGHWQDADQSGGQYLRFFSSPHRVASPEYFVPTGVAYNACMVSGNCSNELLDQIYRAEMTMTVYYYRVARVQEGLERFPLRQVGPDWQANVANQAVTAVADQRSEQPLLDQRSEQSLLDQRSEQPSLDQRIYLPLLFTAPAPPAELPDGDATGCPCGWFDGNGRMLDFIPAP